MKAFVNLLRLAHFDAAETAQRLVSGNTASYKLIDLIYPTSHPGQFTLAA